MIHLLVALLAIILITSRSGLWRWIAARSFGELLLVIAVISFAALSVIKTAGY